MKLQLWRVFGGTFLAGVLLLMLATNHRFLSNAYMLVDPSPDWSGAVALMIMLTMVLALMFPKYPAARWIFLALAVTVTISVAINAGSRLGLIDAAPLQWKWLVLLFASLPFFFVSWLAWVLVVNHISTPILAAVSVEASTSGQRALSTDPASTIPILHPMSTTAPPLDASTTVKVDNSVDTFAVDDAPPVGNPGGQRTASVGVVEVIGGNVKPEYWQAVHLHQHGMNLADIARRQGLSNSESVRKRFRVCWRSDRAAVESAIPGWVADNQNFLHSDK